MYSFFQFVSLMICSFVPLLMVALSGMVTERGGVTNVGLEGIMVGGGFCGVLAMNYMCEAFGVPHAMLNNAGAYIDSAGAKALIFIVALIASMLGGTLLSFIHGFASIRLRANQIIASTALNIFVPALCLFLTFSLGLGTRVGTYRIPLDNDLFYIPRIPGCRNIPILGGTQPTIYVGLVVLVVIAILLNRTRFGLRLKACGENPFAAAAAGVSVRNYRYAGVLISGAVAGMAGFFYASTMVQEFDMSVIGFGFLGLAVMIFGNWKPGMITLGALVFSFFQTLGSGYTFIPGVSSWDINPNVFFLLPYVITLLVLIFTSKHNRAPAADGVPYDVGHR